MIALLRRVLCRDGLGRRGAVAIMFAVSAVPLTIGVGAAIDLARIADGRAALQRAVDNAALSGAAAYVAQTAGDAFNAVAFNMAVSAFCNATPSTPAGFTLGGATGGQACASGPGPSVTAAIGGYAPGTRGAVANSGCSATNTVVAGLTCGFIVTVSANATMATIFPVLLGSEKTISVTASAVNPFIDLGTAIAPTLKGSATYANSLWVYPLRLDADGNPDFTSNAGALPDASACSGDPAQTVCGNYSMLASTKYAGCTTQNPCTVNGAVFGGAGGIVQNISAGQTVITATTPLGFAFETTAGGNNSYGYNTSSQPQPADGCTWPAGVDYNTVSQVYDASGAPQLPWSLPTHWFYSSFLANGLPPSQIEIALQTNRTTNPLTGLPYNVQDIPAVMQVLSGRNSPASCANPTAATNRERLITTYRTSGQSNCSLYIVRDPVVDTPDPTLKVGQWQTGNCFNPTNTPGQKYAALSCASFAGHRFAFFWNDMGGHYFDDTDYGNGTLIISCSSNAAVILID